MQAPVTSQQMITTTRNVKNDYSYLVFHFEQEVRMDHFMRKCTMDRKIVEQLVLKNLF